MYNGVGAAFETTPCASLSYAQRPFSRAGSKAAVVIGKDIDKSVLDKVRGRFEAIEMDTHIIGLCSDPIPIDVPVFNFGSTLYECIVLLTTDEDRIKLPQVEEAFKDAINHGKTVVDVSGKAFALAGRSEDADQGMFAGAASDEEMWDTMFDRLTKIFRYYERQSETVMGKMDM